MTLNALQLRRRTRSVAGLLAAAVLVIPGLGAAASGASAAAPGFVTNVGGRLRLDAKPFRFAGTNEYYLGLDDNVRDAGGAPTYPTHWRTDNALGAAAALGATVVRSHTLGISVGNPRSIEPRLRQWNDPAFEPIDYAIASAGRDGLRLMIPLTDQWRWYHGGKSVFTGWRGYPNDPDPARNAGNNAAQRESESHFYTDPQVISDFKDYIQHVLTHRNTYTGVALKDDPTIAIWETGNEMWDAPPAWTENIAAYIKSIAPRQLVADGSAATGKHVAQAAIGAPHVDVLGGHFYPRNPLWLMQDAAEAARNGKAYVVGEFDWTGDLAGWLSQIEQDPNIAGDLYWALLPRMEDGSPEPHNDGYQMWSPGTDATMQGSAILLHGHADRMRGTAAPFAGADGAVPDPAIWRVWASAGSRADLLDGGLRLSTGQAGSYQDKATVQAADVRADGGVRVSATATSATEAYFSVVLRGTGTDAAVGDGDGYRVEVNAQGVAQVQRRGSQPAALSPGLAIPGFELGKPFNLAFSVSGSRLSLTLWTGATAPSSATWVGTDSVVTGAGRAGLVLCGGGAGRAGAEWRVQSWQPTAG